MIVRKETRRKNYCPKPNRLAWLVSELADCPTDQSAGWSSERPCREVWLIIHLARTVNRYNFISTLLLNQLARSLAWSVASLVRCSVGWSVGRLVGRSIVCSEGDLGFIKQGCLEEIIPTASRRSRQIPNCLSLFYFHIEL